MTAVLSNDTNDNESVTDLDTKLDTKKQLFQTIELESMAKNECLSVTTKRPSGTTTTSPNSDELISDEQHRLCKRHEHVVKKSSTILEQSPVKNNRFGRAVTVSVPTRGFLKQDMAVYDEDKSSVVSDTLPSARLMRSKSWTGCLQRENALEAIVNRQVSFGYSTAAPAREIVREMYPCKFREFPEECLMSTEMEMQVGSVWRKMTLEIDRDGVNCQRVSLFRKKMKEFQIAKDHLLAAALKPGFKNVVEVHYMLPGKGKHDRRLFRRYRIAALRFGDETIAAKLVTSLQLFVKWMARVPETVTRRIKVIVNPSSGRRRGRQIWEHWKPLLELANIYCDVDETEHSGHARDIGATFDLKVRYEAIVFVGGDGTVNEFMNGVFTQEESAWCTLVATTPISLICAGTDNAFGKGVGIPTHAASVFCIIKRKIRPLDILTCQASNEDGTTRLRFACTGVSYGVGSDIALESEATRWLGVYRYFYLKIKRGVIAPHKHEAKISYILSDSTPVDPKTGEQVLRTYYELMDDTAEDQHHVECCSVYDDSDPTARQWKGDAESIFHPALEEKYAGQWHNFSSELTSAGGSNVYFETKYLHPSDGNFDLIYSRKGNFKQTANLVVRYLLKSYLNSDLMGYYKVKALVIEPTIDDVLNVDGEVFAGPGPFRVEVVPQLLCVLSEK